jgi:hypothetical protein
MYLMVQRISETNFQYLIKINCLFYCKLLYVFRVPFTPIIRSTGNCSLRPPVQAICRDTLDGVACNPLERVHGQINNTRHHGQVKIGLSNGLLATQLYLNPLYTKLIYLRDPSTRHHNKTLLKRDNGWKTQFISE